MGEDSQLSEFFEWLYLDGIPILDYKDLVESSNKLNDYVGPIHSMPLWHSASIRSEEHTHTHTHTNTHTHSPLFLSCSLLLP